MPRAWLLPAVLALVLVGGLAAVSVDTVAAREPSPVAPRGHVVVISVDGLNPRAIRRLGPRAAPHLHRMIRRGVATLNARTVRERTITLPNHAAMMAGRRVAAHRGGHGVSRNRYPAGTTMGDLAGEEVASIFDVVHQHGGTTSLFTGKGKFRLFRDSWRPAGAIDHYERRGATRRLVRRAVRRLVRTPDTLTFLHLRNPDRAGHRAGYMSRPYLRAVRRTDGFVGRIIRAVARTPALRRSTAVLLTSDHGGRGKNHANRHKRVNYTVPFIAWGHGVAKGHNLYRINPHFRSPGKRRTTYRTTPPPVRNGDVANLALSVLGLPAVPDSTLDPRQRLRVVP